MKIVAFSDTHNNHHEVELPLGDVLVFAGDFMTCGRRFEEVQSFGRWFSSQPHKHKILVAGNHDRLMEKQLPLCINEFSKDVIYLNDSGCTIDGIKFWGSPVQPWFCDWAFNVHRGPDIKKHWDKIPNDTDVLITHGPPYGYGDQAYPNATPYPKSSIIRSASEHLGCEELMLAVERVNPSIHIFGHIHGGYGVQGYTNQQAERLMMPYQKVETYFHNVAICDEQYDPVNKPHQLYIERE